MRTAALNLGFKTAERLGVDIVARNYYSPIPHPPPAVYEQRSELHGIQWDADRFLATLDRLIPDMAAFAPPVHFAGNPMYGPIEAEVLHAIVRQARPGRVVELGSGFSSLVIAQAIDANCEYRIFDPFPRAFIREGGFDCQLVGTTGVPTDVFLALERNDILFVDTTHTVKTGSDVNRIVLDVLPQLAPGVLVHVHDIFLPYEYPRSFHEKRLYWSEQYLLRAFLAHNPAFEIVLPLHALVRDHPEKVPGAERGRASAFWIRRR